MEHLGQIVPGRLTVCVGNATNAFILNEYTSACYDPNAVDANYTCSCVQDSPSILVQLPFFNETSSRIEPGVLVLCSAPPMPPAPSVASREGSATVTLFASAVSSGAATSIQSAACVMSTACATEDAEGTASDSSMAPFSIGDGVEGKLLGAFVFVASIILLHLILFGLALGYYSRKEKHLNAKKLAQEALDEKEEDFLKKPTLEHAMELSKWPTYTIRALTFGYTGVCFFSFSVFNEQSSAQGFVLGVVGLICCLAFLIYSQVKGRLPTNDCANFIASLKTSLQEDQQNIGLLMDHNNNTVEGEKKEESAAEETVKLTNTEKETLIDRYNHMNDEPLGVDQVLTIQSRTIVTDILFPTAKSAQFPYIHYVQLRRWRQKSVPFYLRWLVPKGVWRYGAGAAAPAYTEFFDPMASKHVRWLTAIHLWKGLFLAAIAGSARKVETREQCNQMYWALCVILFLISFLLGVWTPHRSSFDDALCVVMGLLTSAIAATQASPDFAINSVVLYSALLYLGIGSLAVFICCPFIEDYATDKEEHMASEEEMGKSAAKYTIVENENFNHIDGGHQDELQQLESSESHQGNKNTAAAQGAAERGKNNPVEEDVKKDINPQNKTEEADNVEEIEI